MQKTKRKKNHLAKSKRKGRGIGASKTNAYPPKTKTKLNEEDAMDSELRRMVAVREPDYMPLPDGWIKTRIPGSWTYYFHAPTKRTSWNHPIAARTEEEEEEEVAAKAKEGFFASTGKAPRVFWRI